MNEMIKRKINEEELTMDCKQAPQWEGFRGGQWQRTVDVRSFIQKNLTP